MEEAIAVTPQPLSEVALPVGTNLSGDQFTITSRLSAGGFGITYRAQDNFLGRTVVIKECFADDFCIRSDKQVLARNQASEKNFRSIVDMFIREARSLAKLRHPNIVGVHRAFEENGTAYMALDLIVGHDLDNILEVNSTRLPPSGVKDMLLRLLDAVETIHDLDLLHRDISPDNIMIDNDGNPVLIDFGAARGDASRRTRAISSLLVVKDGYSPQELYVAGSIQTPSSDLYALAATFYHVLSGEAPPNSQIRTMEIAGQNPDPCVPLAGRINGYEPAFLEAIDKAMQPLPRDRLQSAGEWLDLIADDNEEALVDESANLLPEVGSEPEASSDTSTAKLTISLSKLVEETNEEVRKTRLIVVEPEQEPLAKPQMSPSPAWLDEFNKDSLADDHEDAFDDLVVTPEDWDDETIVEAAPVDQAASHDVPTAPDSDWINRVRNKQSTVHSVQTSENTGFRHLSEPIVKDTESKSTSRKILADDEMPPMSQMIVPLLKYLSTGIVMGLGAMLLYMSF